MDKKKNDLLKQGLHETNKDFTSSLIDQIEAKEKALSAVISKSGAMETSNNFTADLMLKLEGKVPAKPYKPVISKHAWIGIAAVFCGIILLSFFANGQETDTTKFYLQLEQIRDGISSLFQYAQIITYVCFGILLFTLGLLFEQKWRKTV